ncbi:hypothetical protein M426DRAFT_254280 [Hypoxylon sp. CI-4A]|nr:hypothetical protein M426DRAFT_254280 [Hypoxylon sp. CI-4A]
MPSIAGKDVQWPSGTSVHYPGSQGFTSATARWSSYAAPGFAAVVTPSDEAEVSRIVKAARSAGIPFLATSGRHGYGTSLGKFQNGLAIDLSQLKAIDINKEASTITLGAGVRIGEAGGPIHDAGYQLPVGTCNAVSVIGATLGGGVGAFQGLFGLIVDSLVSARLVTADGNLVEVSESSNSDLFWGLRGAGFNFGIVTLATYRLHKEVNGGQIMTADLVYPSHLSSEYFNTLQEFLGKMPAELSMVSTIAWDPNSNASQIIASMCYSGTETEGRKLLAPFFDLNPLVARVSVEPYNKLPSVVLFGMVEAGSKPGDIHDIVTVNVRKIDAKTFKSAFEKFDSFYKAFPEGRGSIGVFETFSNHAVTAVPDDATAYPWRDTKGNLMFQMTWSGLDNPVEKEANALARELRQEFVATSGYPDLSVYVSYAWGDETLEQIYGKKKLPRLAALKKQWDPDNVFGYHNALPTEYS